MTETGEREQLRASPLGHRVGGLGGVRRRQRGREKMEVKAWGLPEVTECLGREWIAGREVRGQREGGGRFPRRTALGRG